MLVLGINEKVFMLFIGFVFIISSLVIHIYIYARARVCVCVCVCVCVHFVYAHAHAQTTQSSLAEVKQS